MDLRSENFIHERLEVIEPKTKKNWRAVLCGPDLLHSIQYSFPADPTLRPPSPPPPFSPSSILSSLSFSLKYFFGSAVSPPPPLLYTPIISTRREKTQAATRTHPKDGYTSNNLLILLRCHGLIYTRNPFVSGGGGRGGYGATRGWGALRWHGSSVRLGGVDV